MNASELWDRKKLILMINFLILPLFNHFFGTFSLDSEERATVMSLANYDDVSCDILGIFKTNAMNISPSEAALFPWVCRANHSCVPNCNYHHDSQTGLQHLYSATRILQGEELTVSYLPDNMLGCRAARQSHLMKSHRYPVTHLPVIITCTQHDYLYAS